jgi:hypothetical protein
VITTAIHRWHRWIDGDTDDGLDDLLADDVVFYSPVVYTPQRGRDVTAMYLQAARRVLPGDRQPDGARSFRYVKEVVGADTAVLEFETTIEGKYVNGVDIIRYDGTGRIVEFRVMIRPLQAVNLMHEQMRAILERFNA